MNVEQIYTFMDLAGCSPRSVDPLLRLRLGGAAQLGKT